MTTLTSELKNFFLWINMTSGAEKITIGSGVKGEHYTIRFWSRRKCLDLHMTNEVTGEHKTIFEIKYYTLFKLLIRLTKYQEYLIRKHLMTSTINLGKLKHYNCILFAQTTDEKELSDILKIKRGRMKFHKNVDWTILARFYLTPDELLQSDKEVFQVYKYKNGNLRQQGFLYKLPNRKNEKKFIFITKKVFRTFNKRLMNVTFNLLNQQNFENKQEIMKLLYERINYNHRKQTA